MQRYNFYFKIAKFISAKMRKSAKFISFAMRIFAKSQYVRKKLTLHFLHYFV